MSVQSIGLIGMGVLVLMIFLRVPVAIAMGLVGLCGYAAVSGWDRAVHVLGQVPFDVASGYGERRRVVVPSAVAERSRIS